MCMYMRLYLPVINTLHSLWFRGRSHGPVSIGTNPLLFVRFSLMLFHPPSLTPRRQKMRLIIIATGVHTVAAPLTRRYPPSVQETCRHQPSDLLQLVCSACARPGQVPLGSPEFLLGLFPCALVWLIHSAFTADAGVHLVMAVKTLKTTPLYGVWKRGWREVPHYQGVMNRHSRGAHEPSPETLFTRVSDPSWMSEFWKRGWFIFHPKKVLRIHMLMGLRSHIKSQVFWPFDGNDESIGGHSGSRSLILLYIGANTTWLHNNGGKGKAIIRLVTLSRYLQQPFQIHCGITYASFDIKVLKYVTCQHFKGAVICSLLL